MKTFEATNGFKPTTRRLLAAAAFCGALAMPLSATAQQSTNGQAASSPTQWVQTIEDATIAATIQSEYIVENKPWYNDVDVQVSDGTVTLKGKVATLRDKRVAATLASTVRGVTEIDNKLKVMPRESVTSSELVDSVERALLINTATESFEIDVQANDQGRVTLTGEVESFAERYLAEDVAASVRGIRAIDNQIAVEYAEERIASEIRQDILETLEYDALIDASNINVTVENDTVTLSGQVGSLAEQQRATMSAYVSGVQSVDDSDLAVETDYERVGSSGSLTDDEVQDAIEATLLYNPEVSSMNVDVFVYNDGRAQLTGDVPTLKAKRTAEQLTSETAGVRRVDNFLRVQPVDQPDDMQIKRQITQTLLENSMTELYEIDATVDHGSVTLTGDVDTYLEKWEASSAIASIRGVTSIDNQIDVQQTTSWVYYDPYVYPGVMPGADEQPTDRSTLTTDDDIAEDIENQFFWSPFVDGDDIDVTVDEGTARLTGTVEDIAERRSATENAFEGGAIVVDNDLIVTGQ